MTRKNAAEILETSQNDGAASLDPKLASLMKEEVGKTREENLPVNRAFEAIAEKSGLKFNTVRNYYYRYIHEKEKNQKKQKTTSKSSKPRTRNQSIAGNSFTGAEVRKLVMVMLQAQAEGESVRSCANRLANNDPKLMLRYQNKYRNIITSNQKYVENLMEEMANKGIPYFDPFRKVSIGSKNEEKTVSPNLEQYGVANRVDADYQGEELLGVVGQLIANMREIDGKTLKDFFTGLRDLSNMAVQWKQREEQVGETGVHLRDMQDTLNRFQEFLKEKDYQIHELNAKILSYETRMEDQKRRIARHMSAFHQIMGVNRNFLNLSAAGKLSGLAEYTKELEAFVKDYDKEMAD